MTTPRKICVNCGAKYGRRDTQTDHVVWPEGAEKPAYRGNKIVIREEILYRAPHAVTGSFSGVPFGYNDNVLMRRTWDGHTWHGGYDPFCTLYCALNYARKAYAKGSGHKKLRQT